MRIMKLVNLIPLKEIDFRNQDAFDAYIKQHDLRPSTKVKIAGKTTTAGKAAQKSAPVKGTSVFGGGKDKSISDIKMDNKVDLDAIAGLTPGFTGADLANLANEATLIATRESASYVTIDHFTRGLERIITGLEKKNRIMNPKEKEIVAHHEMGHALTGHAFNQDDKIHKVSIIPHGIGSMGYTIQRPTEERYVLTKADLENKITVLLGGRAAEMIMTSQLSTGAADDLLKATSIAREMVMRFGMTQELGFVAFEEQGSSLLNPKELIAKNTYSEESAKEIDECVKRIIMHAYLKAYDFLKTHRTTLEKAAKALQEKERLSEEDLTVFFAELDLK